MLVTFVRERDRRYRTAIVRDDRVEVKVPSYDRTSSLPHDLAHFVVESELSLGRGFWGSVANGALFAGVAVVRGRRRPHAAERSKALLKANHDQIIEAEVLVGAFIKLIDAEIVPRSLRAKSILDRRWMPRSPDAGEVCLADIDRVRAALCDARSQWDLRAIGEQISVKWRLRTAT